jgi:hypothetical protein
MEKSCPDRSIVWLPLLLLGAALGAVFGIYCLSRSEWVEARIRNWELARFAAGTEHFVNAGMFREFEDHLILEDLANADYSKGGTYFLGTSAMKWALKTWELPPERRPFICNYGIGATSHEMEFQFLRFLVEQRGLLRAGGQNVHVVLGAYWSMGTYWPPNGYFGMLWKRHRLFDYSPAKGISALNLNRVQRLVRVVEAHCAGPIVSNVNRIRRYAIIAAGKRITPTDGIRDQAEITKLIRSSAGGSGWEEPLQTQMLALRETVTYLKDRGVRVSIAMLPTRKGFFELELPNAYYNQIRRLGGDLDIPVIDLTRLLSEDEFWDINHSNLRGLHKTHAALMALAEEHAGS